MKNILIACLLFTSVNHLVNYRSRCSGANGVLICPSSNHTWMQSHSYHTPLLHLGRCKSASHQTRRRIFQVCIPPRNVRAVTLETCKPQTMHVVSKTAKWVQSSLCMLCCLSNSARYVAPTSYSNDPCCLHHIMSLDRQTTHPCEARGGHSPQTNIITLHLRTLMPDALKCPPTLPRPLWNTSFRAEGIRTTRGLRAHAGTSPPHCPATRRLALHSARASDTAVIQSRGPRRHRCLSRDSPRHRHATLCIHLRWRIG